MDTAIKQTLNAKQKSREINLGPDIYGAFAEIGAGQEVVRHFFRAGGAAGTIAKTMSAYDMKFSDDIYGREPGGRYVSKSRILRMLKHEFALLQKRLKDRKHNTRFFAFANTVAAKSYQRKTENHGWMGLHFQHIPNAPVSEVILHVRMLDKENVQQQESLGVIGVNLIYACFKRIESQERFVVSLMDNLSIDRIEIDMIHVQGPAFKGLDSRLLSLELVKRDFCKVVMFDGQGNILQASDALYKKNVVLCRGSYRPPTLLNVDMLEKGTKSFQRDLSNKKMENILVLPEISMSKLVEQNGRLDNQDFLARIKLLNALNYNVLISNYKYYWELSHFISTYNKEKIAYIMGVYNLEEFFHEIKKQEDEIGPLRALGLLIGKTTTLYIYPAEDETYSELVTYEKARVTDSIQLLLRYLAKEKRIKNIDEANRDLLSIWSREILKMIEQGVSGWEKSVPQIVKDEVKKKKLFGA